MVISPLGHAYSSALPKRQQPCPIAVTMLGFVEPRSRKTDLAITNALAGIAVEDITEAIDFYQTLFGRPADARPMHDVAEWKTTGGGWIQVLADADRAGASSLTLVVDDLAEELGRLALLGLDPVAKAMGDFFKTAKFRDPDGNQITLSQPQPGTY
jgi:predicted enzyme related to lactoylglutathione lyase